MKLIVKIVNRTSLINTLLNMHCFHIDINECITSLSLCKLHISECINLPGSYKCNCGSGYTLGVDGKTCQGHLLVVIKNYFKYSLFCVNVQNRFIV